ncbi:hypothetical protein ACN28S_03435 [Cystobacter fuscus]
MNPALSLDTPRPLKEYAPTTLELLKAIRREGFLGWMTNTGASTGICSASGWARSRSCW